MTNQNSNTQVVERLSDETGDDFQFVQAGQLPMSKFAAKHLKGDGQKIRLEDLKVLLPEPEAVVVPSLISKDLLAELFQDAEADCADIESAQATLVEAKRIKTLANQIMDEKVKPAYAVVLDYQAQIARVEKEQSALPALIRDELFANAKELFATYREAGAMDKWNALSEKLEKAVPAFVEPYAAVNSSKLEELQGMLRLAKDEHAKAMAPAIEYDIVASRMFAEYNAVMFKLGVTKK